MTINWLGITWFQNFQIPITCVFNLGMYFNLNMIIFNKKSTTFLFYFLSCKNDGAYFIKILCGCRIKLLLFIQCTINCLSFINQVLFELSITIQCFYIIQLT